MKPYPVHPAELDIYVETLGHALTVKLILALGGGTFTLSAEPKGKSQLEQVIGYDCLKALSKHLRNHKERIPLAVNWMVHVLHDVEDKSVTEIAVMLKRSDTSVRRQLNTPIIRRLSDVPPPAQPEEDTQLDFGF